MKLLKPFMSVCLLLSGAVAQNAGQEKATLDQAGAAADAGRTSDAIQLYRAVLERESDNPVALGSLSDLLQAKSNSQDAAPYLERLVKLRPQDASAAFQLGRIKSWQSAQRVEALALLRRACDISDHNEEYCTTYADVLSWRSEDRATAIVQLEAVVAAHPESVPPRVKLAQMLSWNTATRLRSLELFDEGLKRNPKNVDLLMASAEVLSWSRPGRSEALVRYERVLEQHPDEQRALTGKAQLLSWEGRSDEALVIYQKVLAKDPANTAALQGAADILNWKGHYKEARQLAERARTGEPGNQMALLELARADIGLQRFAEARQVIAEVGGSPNPDFDDVRHEIHRGMGTYMEFGYAFRQQPNHASNNLEYHRFDVAISTPVGPANRVTFVYQPTLLNNPQQGFNSSYFGASLDSSFNERASAHVQVGAEVFQNVPVNVDAGIGFNFKPTQSTALKVNFQRQPVEESALSARGETFNGVFLGQVFSNLADVGISYNNVPHKLDFALDYADGVYTGRNLDANRRISVDAQMGRQILADQPYIRIGYYGNYTSFDHDADIQTGLSLTSQTGGYFSPTRFLVNQGVLTVSHRFTKQVNWGMSGAAGVQNVATSTSAFSNTQFASSFETHLFWRMTPLNEFRFGYDYLNVFNAFERNLFRFSWRHYF